MDINEYKVKFYTNPKGKNPVLDYLESISCVERAKMLRIIEFLREQKGYLDEPYSKHITGAIREFRIDFGRKRHRIFYFAFVGKTIILLHAFLKNTNETPVGEIKKAQENYNDVLRNKKIYE